MAGRLTVDQLRELGYILHAPTKSLDPWWATSDGRPKHSNTFDRAHQAAHDHAMKYATPPKPPDPPGWRVVEFRKVGHGEHCLLAISGIVQKGACGLEPYAGDDGLMGFNWNGRRWIVEREKPKQVKAWAHPNFQCLLGDGVAIYKTQVWPGWVPVTITPGHDEEAI